MKTIATHSLLAVLCLTIGIAIGEHYGAAVDAGWARVLMRAAANADGPQGGVAVRHAAAGLITDITIRPDHVAILGVWGSRQWFSAPSTQHATRNTP